jgi:hypothetical protein
MITGATDIVVLRSLQQVLQRAHSCLSLDVVVHNRPASELRVISRIAPPPGGSAITLNIRHRFVLVHNSAGETRRRWQARTTSYSYGLADVDGREIVVYHWHPEGRSHVTTPHLHLGAGAGALRAELTKAHLATGLVSPTVILALAIESFGVRPRRADWAAMMERTREALEQA